MLQFYLVPTRPQGQAKIVVRHLGAWYHVNNSETVDVQARIRAGRIGWSAMGRFWTQNGIPFHVKRCVFYSMVYNSTLCGGETWVELPRTLYDQIERFIMAHQQHYIKYGIG